MISHNTSHKIFSVKFVTAKFLVKYYIWSMTLYGAETWTLRAADQKHLESSEMQCWRRMERRSVGPIM